MSSSPDDQRSAHTRAGAASDFDAPACPECRTVMHDFAEGFRCRGCGHTVVTDGRSRPRFPATDDENITEFRPRD